MTPNERVEMAEDPSTPIDVLDPLSYGSVWWVRFQVAKNPSTPTDVLVHLSHDPDWSVRYCIVDNPLTPFETVIRLTSDEHEDVKKQAYKSIEERGLIALLNDG